MQELLRSIFQRKINLLFLFLFAFTACCMLPCTTHWQSVERCMIQLQEMDLYTGFKVRVAYIGEAVGIFWKAIEGERT